MEWFVVVQSFLMPQSKWKRHIKTITTSRNNGIWWAEWLFTIKPKSDKQGKLKDKDCLYPS